MGEYQFEHSIRNSLQVILSIVIDERLTWVGVFFTLDQRQDTYSVNLARRKRSCVISANVGRRSILEANLLQVVPGNVLPFQYMIQGTRLPPSKVVAFAHVTHRLNRHDSRNWSKGHYRKSRSPTYYLPSPAHAMP